jgi:hypothetical protein
MWCSSRPQPVEGLGVGTEILIAAWWRRSEPMTAFARCLAQGAGELDILLHAVIPKVAPREAETLQHRRQALGRRPG